MTRLTGALVACAAAGDEELVAAGQQLTGADAVENRMPTTSSVFFIVRS